MFPTTTKVLEKARYIARARLLQRKPPNLPAQAMVGRTDPKAIGFLNALAKLLDVPVDSFSEQDRLRDLLKVTRVELSEVSDAIWAKSGFGDFIEVDAYDALYTLEDTSHSRCLRQRLQECGLGDCTEEELMDQLFAMSLAELCQRFAGCFRDARKLASPIRSPGSVVGG